MHIPVSYCLDMCQKLRSHMFFPKSFQLPRENFGSAQSFSKEHNLTAEDLTSRRAPEEVFNAWLASRKISGQKSTYLVAGAQRPVSVENARLAFSTVVHKSVFQFFKDLWKLNPARTTLMMTLNVVRSLFPAFRGYSQAMIVDELQSLISSGNFTWCRLVYLVSAELLRRVLEAFLDTFATYNEFIVLESAKFFVEHQQLKKRVQLDVPTLSDPVVRDLLQESDLFVRSFNGGGFGLLSPLDFVHVLSLAIELTSHIYIIASLTCGATNLGILVLSVASITLPLLLPWCKSPLHSSDFPSSPREARAIDRRERMRNLVYSDAHRPEIALFGLGKWILEAWSSARQVVSISEQPQLLRDLTLASQINLSDLFFALQNIPLVWLMKISSTSLGSLSLYRSSIQSVVFAYGSLIRTIKMAFQGIFLMSAFCASMKLKPRLQPNDSEQTAYRSLPGGVNIEASGLSYSYLGSSEPALRKVNFSLAAGETLAVVGYNGSGKTTLAKILLRIIDFDEGSLKINGIDVRRYHPDDYHRHVTAVFQGFSKFDATLQENVGVGYIPQLENCSAVEKAIHVAEAEAVVKSLPNGLQTPLSNSGFESISYPGMSAQRHSTRHGLSGGEWQRIAIARAFMRAGEPEVDLLVFDEPTSSLDAYAQNQIFDAIEKLSKTPSGQKTKSVIFITHRLATARRANKIAMMENGTISEFGTHEELLKRNGSYAALYRASI